MKTDRYRPKPRPVNLADRAAPVTPADHASIERMAAANVTAVAIGRICVALKADYHADLDALLEQAAGAWLRLTNADGAYTALTRPDTTNGD